MLQVNAVIDATISAVEDYGLILDFEGKKGFVQPIEIKWSGTVDVKGEFHPGDKVKVFVYAISENMFFASIKKARPESNPWLNSHIFGRGTIHEGVVARVVSWGVVVEFESKATGMIVGEQDSIKEGDKIRVRVVDFDPIREKLTLERVY